MNFLIHELKVDINEPKDPHHAVQGMYGHGQITPLVIAISRGNFELANYLMSQQAKVTPAVFYFACKHQDLNYLESILNKLR